MSYMSGQTLVHKTKRTLARLAVTEYDGTFHWGRGADTAFIDENGRKFTDKLSNYTHVSDEWGNAHCNGREKGQHVDISAKKYLVSRQKLAAMRKRVLDTLEQNFKECMDLMVKTIMNPPAKSDVKFGEVVTQHPRFYFSYSHVLRSIQFFTPHISSKYFNSAERFAKYLRENGWNVVLFRQGEDYRVVSGISQVFAEKNGKTLCWDCESHISLKTRMEVL